jgi:hypothetical protein
MSDEHLPTGNTGVFQLLAIIATAFASAGALLLLTGGSVIGFAALAFSILIFIVGLKWSVVQRHTGEQFVVVVDKITKSRNSVFLLVAAG